MSMTYFTGDMPGAKFGTQIKRVFEIMVCHALEDEDLREMGATDPVDAIHYVVNDRKVFNNVMDGLESSLLPGQYIQTYTYTSGFAWR